MLLGWRMRARRPPSIGSLSSLILSGLGGMSGRSELTGHLIVNRDLIIIISMMIVFLRDKRDNRI
jgi:hypothetical protein